MINSARVDKRQMMPSDTYSFIHSSLKVSTQHFNQVDFDWAVAVPSLGQALDVRQMVSHLTLEYFIYRGVHG